MNDRGGVERYDRVQPRLAQPVHQEASHRHEHERAVEQEQPACGAPVNDEIVCQRRAKEVERAVLVEHVADALQIERDVDEEVDQHER
eukprot:5298759-Prymnesium_polylepis.1